MKIILNIILVLFLVPVSMSYAESETIKLVIQSPIVIGKTKVGFSKIVSLSNKAIQSGYDEIFLKGSINYKMLPNKKTRVKINWSSLKQTIGSSDSNTPLTSSMTSQFIVDDKRVDAGTELSAKGDLENLSKSLDEALTTKASSGTGATDSSEEEEAKKAAQKINSPTSAAVDNGGYSDPTSEESSPSTTDSGATLTITSYEACSPRIDSAGGLVYEQTQKVTTLETGEEQSRDSCTDTGTTAPIVKTYETCGVLEDIQGGFVYKKYKETANLNSDIVLVTDCTVDLTSKFTVENDYSVCGKRHDFINSVSIQQEQFYYLDGSNSRIDLGECVDSEVSFAHYLTLNTCTATVDEVNGYVFPQKRTAYQVTNGTIEYASECAPVETDSVALSTEFCPQKYEHDFNAGQSYLRIQSYYNDFQTTEKILVGVCSRDTTISFPHVHEQAGCTTEYDDVNLINLWNSNTQIDLTSQSEGTLEIAACAQYGNPTPYLYVNQGYIQTSSASDSICAQQYIRENDGSSTYVPPASAVLTSNTWKSGSTLNTSYFNPNTSLQTWSTTFCSTSTDGLKDRYLNTKRFNWSDYRRYKRGDNSLYDYPTGTVQNNTYSLPKIGVNTL